MARLGALAAVLVVVLDQLGKWWILDHFAARPGTVEVTPFFNIVLVMNRGVSFGLVPVGGALGPVAVRGDRRGHRRRAGGVAGADARTRLEALAIGLVIGGAVGNVIDRLRHGGVVDFLDFHLGGYHWPAFNAADAAIVCGVAALLYAGLWPQRRTS